MSAHTPGPWRWEFNRQAKSVYLVGGKPRYDKTVMQFARWGMSGATPLFNSAITGDEFNIMERPCDMADWVKPFPNIEHHASWRANLVHPDARLMAAAPDLLDALKAAKLELHYCSQQLVGEGWSVGSTVKKALDDAEAAIAKATGASS